MRHLNSGRKLNRTASHRKAMFANLSVSLLDKERIVTTTAKAKELRGVVERLITYGKRAYRQELSAQNSSDSPKVDIHHRRLAARTLNNKDVVRKLFTDIAPGFKDREGGYTRIIKYKNRKGDNSEMSIIELVGRNGDEPRKRKTKKRSQQTKQKHETQAPKQVVNQSGSNETVPQQQAQESKNIETGGTAV